MGARNLRSAPSSRVCLRRTAQAASLAMLGLALLAVNCSGHAFMRSPRSRVLAQNILGNAGGDIEYVASSGNGGGTGRNPRVCGDPHQGPNELGLENRAGNPEGECPRAGGAPTHKHP